MATLVSVDLSARVRVSRAPTYSPSTNPGSSATISSARPKSPKSCIFRRGRI